MLLWHIESKQGKFGSMSLGVRWKLQLFQKSTQLHHLASISLFLQSKKQSYYSRDITTAFQTIFFFPATQKDCIPSMPCSLVDITSFLVPSSLLPVWLSFFQDMSIDFEVKSKGK
jgi:hypothetical protein